MQESIALHPPLKLLWALADSFAAVTVSEEGVTFAPLSHRGKGLAAVAPNGQVLWTRSAKGPCEAQPLPGGKRLMSADSPKYETLNVLNAGTGAVEWTGKYLQVLPVRAGEHECLAIDWLIPKGRARVVGITIPPEPQVRWERSFQVTGRPRTHLAVRAGPRDAESVFLLDQCQPNQPALVSVSIKGGEEIWRMRALELPAQPRTEGAWCGGLADGDRLVYRTNTGLACVDARTGQSLWAATIAREGTVFRDVIVATHERTVWMLSAETGRLLRKKDLTKALSARRPGNRLTIGCAISETHVFVCDELGTLWALDRESLEPVWSHCPAGTVGGLNSPRIIRGRLYANTVSWERGVPNHLYCWGPAKEGESPGPSDIDVADTEGELPFVIVEVYPRQQLTTRAPFHEAGGPFTVFRCRLEAGGAEFFFADRVAGGGGLLQGAAAALWVTTVKEGDGLLRAFRQSMPVKKRRMKGVGKGVRVKAPRALRGVDLHGPGARQRRKWNSADSDAELIVEWDTKANRGVIRETEEIFREGVLELMAGLLVRPS